MALWKNLASRSYSLSSQLQVVILTPAVALGIASGVAGLASLGIELCQSLLDYYGSWKDAESEAMTTYSSVEEHTKILLLMRSTLANQHLNPEMLANVQGGMALCEGRIVNLKEKLQKTQLELLRDTVVERLRSQAWGNSTYIPLRKHVNQTAGDYSRFTRHIAFATDDSW
ncbi:hypothetical protein TrVFT333_011464 [Trichoderma virens FT-333]|nr:hypothetical protein TrVFT333_011464 [Trichoderma virens FT-333]